MGCILQSESLWEGIWPDSIQSAKNEARFSKGWVCIWACFFWVRLETPTEALTGSQTPLLGVWDPCTGDFPEPTSDGLVDWRFYDSWVPTLLFKQQCFLFWGLRLISREVVSSRAQPNPVQTRSPQRFLLQELPVSAAIPCHVSECKHLTLAGPSVFHQPLHSRPMSVSITSLPCSKASKATPWCSEQGPKSSELATAHFSDLRSYRCPHCSLCSSPWPCYFPTHQICPCPRPLHIWFLLCGRLFPRIEHGLLSLHPISSSHLFREVSWLLCKMEPHSCLFSLLYFCQGIYIYLVGWFVGLWSVTRTKM